MKFNHTAHKKLWLWLSEDTCREKIHWPGWEHNGGDTPMAINECVACGYAYSKTGSILVCNHCPLVWPGGGCTGKRGLFKLWCLYPGEGKELAKRIANLPVKDGIDCI